MLTVLDKENKYKELLTKSNPKQVNKLSRKYYGRDVEISDRKNKKYMIQDDAGVWHHFGDIRYEDYTHHKNKDRLDNFKKRNWKWGNAEPYTPSNLSYYLLW